MNKNYKMEIIDYPNYTIYTAGCIWSKKFEIFLKPQINKDGYSHYTLSNKGLRKHFYLHRLLGIHFIDNPENKPTVDHIDVDPSNNHLSNLRWATYSEQALNKKKKSNTGENHISISSIKKYKYYQIEKETYFKQYLRCDKFSLDDAINLRDSLLGLI